MCLTISQVNQQQWDDASFCMLTIFLNFSLGSFIFSLTYLQVTYIVTFIRLFNIAGEGAHCSMRCRVIPWLLVRYHAYLQCLSHEVFLLLVTKQICTDRLQTLTFYEFEVWTLKSHKSDQDRISPKMSIQYKADKRWVWGKIINKGNIVWSNTKFSEHK